MENCCGSGSSLRTTTFTKVVLDTRKKKKSILHWTVTRHVPYSELSHHYFAVHGCVLHCSTKVPPYSRSPKTNNNQCWKKIPNTTIHRNLCKINLFQNPVFCEETSHWWWSVYILHTIDVICLQQAICSTIFFPHCQADCFYFWIHTLLQLFCSRWWTWWWFNVLWFR